MTSRARRIVLAMYGHPRPLQPVTVTSMYQEDAPPFYRTAHCCYEAMDEPDEFYPDYRPRVLVGGNYGLPCA